MKYGIIIGIATLICIFMLAIVTASNGTKECLEWRIVYPTPTPIPLSTIYSEWIPKPGTAISTGNGWVKAIDFARKQQEWPPTPFLIEYVLTDEEYNKIAEEHGLLHTHVGKWRYGFQSVQGFPLLYGGVTLKNEWLPERFQK